MNIINIKKESRLGPESPYNCNRASPMIRVISLTDENEVYDFYGLEKGDLAKVVIASRFTLHDTIHMIQNLSKFFSCGGIYLRFSDIAGNFPEYSTLNSLFENEINDVESFVVDMGFYFASQFNTPIEFWGEE